MTRCPSLVRGGRHVVVSESPGLGCLGDGQNVVQHCACGRRREVYRPRNGVDVVAPGDENWIEEASDA